MDHTGTDKMNKRVFATAAAAALGLAGMAALAFAQDQAPIQGPGFKPGAPSWYIEGSAADPKGQFPTVI